MRLAAAAGTATVSPAHDGLVRLLIDSDRDHLLEQLVARIRPGLDYPTLLGAIAEASVRQVRPYPHVGFKYHAFMVLHAVHLTTRLGRPRIALATGPLVGGRVQGLTSRRAEAGELVSGSCVRPSAPAGREGRACIPGCY